MGVMSELYLEIEDQLMQRIEPSQVAKNLNIPVRIVREVQEELMLYVNLNNTERMNVYERT
jgi:hypothetical protein